MENTTEGETRTRIRDTQFSAIHAILATFAIRTNLTMKLTIALSLLASASAFMTQTAPAFTTRLHTARVDASDAIQQALEASRKYGAASPEAKVAWDAVEEISAADNRYVLYESYNAFARSGLAHLRC